MPSKIKTNKESIKAKVKNAENPSHGACKLFLACSVNSHNEGYDEGSP